ncbi:MAG: D-alanine--D-alanine ligase [Planctomycetota bacterium]
MVEDLDDISAVVNRRPDLVVLCVKYIPTIEPGNKLWLAKYLQEHGIPFTGSDRETLRFDSDKAFAKRHLIERDIKTARFFLAQPGSVYRQQDLPLALPLFVKPLDAANGNGIDEYSLVHDFASYESRVAHICKAYQTSALVEDVLPGREFTVAILDDPWQSNRLIMPIEIVVPKNAKGDRVLGCVEKSNNKEELSLVEEPILSAVSALASQVFSELGARDFGRIDVKLNAANIPHFIEANLVPGMTPGNSYFPMASMLNRGMSYADTVLKMIEVALRRYERPAMPLPAGLARSTS